MLKLYPCSIDDKKSSNLNFLCTGILYFDGSRPYTHGFTGFQQCRILSYLGFFGYGIPGHYRNRNTRRRDKYGNRTRHFPVHRVGRWLVLSKGRNIQKRDHIQLVGQGFGHLGGCPVQWQYHHWFWTRTKRAFDFCSITNTFRHNYIFWWPLNLWYNKLNKSLFKITKMSIRIFGTIPIDSLLMSNFNNYRFNHQQLLSWLACAQFN